jgi:hypothetical protein
VIDHRGLEHSSKNTVFGKARSMISREFMTCALDLRVRASESNSATS